MPKLFSLLPFGAVLVAVSLLAQEVDPPLPPRTPSTPPGEPTESSTPKVNIPPASSTPPPRVSTTSVPEAALPVKTRARSTPMPVATPMPTPVKRPGFWERLFGRRTRATPAPRYVPVATPTPRSTSAKAGSRAKSQTSEKTSSYTGTAARTEKVDKPKGTPLPPKTDTERTTSTSEPSREKATPAPERTKTTPAPKTTPVPKATPEPKPPKTTKSGSKSTPAPASEESGDPEEAERNKFADVKRQAAEDPEVVKLKEKADAAANDDEARQALRAYNKALFQKMRKLDGSLKDRIDATEAVIMRRLGGE